MTEKRTADILPEGDSKAVDASTKGTFHVGERLQAMRKSRGLSQRELARKAGITNGSLSLIEQGKVSPSFQSLEKIICALPMSLVEFFDESYTPLSPVLKKQELDQVSSKGATITILSLDFIGLPASRLAEQRLEAGAQYQYDRVVGAGTLCGLLVSGEMVLELGGAVYSVLAGDCFRFDLRREHRFINVGTSCACAVILVCSAKSM